MSTIVEKIREYNFREVNNLLDVLINTSDESLKDDIIWAIMLVLRLKGVKTDILENELKEYIHKKK